MAACRICGADEWVQRSDRANQVRCRPCMRKRQALSARKARRADPAKRLWDKARERAARAGLPFTVRIEDVRAAWPKDGRCPVFGVEMQIATGRSTDLSPSLDRLNSSWGYEPGNIAVVSMKANRLKSNVDAADLERVAAWMRAQGLA